MVNLRDELLDADIPETGWSEQNRFPSDFRTVLVEKIDVKSAPESSPKSPKIANSDPP